MDLESTILTPTAAWPADPAALTTAIRTQGPFAPAVVIDGALVHVREATHGLLSTIRLDRYAPGAYETLLASGAYTPRMTDRDRDTALPFQRQIRIGTASSPAGDAAAQALFHVTVADGLWWLMGGFLVDPYRHTIWGWRSWRGDMPLPQHGDALRTAGAGAPAGGQA